MAEKKKEDLDEDILSDLEDIEKDLDDISGEEPEEEESDEITEEEISDEEELEEQSEEMLESEDEEILTEEENTEDLSNEDEDGEEELEEEESNEMSVEEKTSAALDEHLTKKNVVEGALFVAGRPIALDELNVKTNITKTELKTLLDELMMEYLSRDGALEIIQIQDKFSLQIKAEYTPTVKKFASGGLIPDAILKTLTIIALKQPISKSTLVKLRGSTTYDHVKFLLDRGYVEAIKKGRSSELTTTDQFADTFGLSRDISTLKKQLITQLGVSGQ